VAERIMVMGETGGGKTSSLRNLDPKETFISQVVSKGLPFKGWRKNYTWWDASTNPKGNMLVRSTSEEICKVMRYVHGHMKHIKNLVIDDAQYVMAKEYMERAAEKGYGKFGDFAAHMSDILLLPDQLRDDLNVIFLWHTDVEEGVTMAKTVGKMLRQAINPEGLFTYVLLSKIVKTQEGGIDHVFVTKSDGTSTVKMPMGMFEEGMIPNDMQLVLNKIKQYNEGE